MKKANLADWLLLIAMLPWLLMFALAGMAERAIQRGRGGEDPKATWRNP